MFKLEQLDQKDRLLRPGICVVDLGAAPGGWSQYAAARLQGRGTIIAIDRLPMEPLDDVQFIKGDFLEESALLQLQAVTPLGSVDLVLSDLAPNLSGIRDADEARCLELYEAALKFARISLKPGGTLVIKVFEARHLKDFQSCVRQLFRKVQIRKPGASRSESREVYLVAKGYNGASPERFIAS